MSGPRVTPADIAAAVAAEYFFTAWDALGDGVPRLEPLKLLTICVLVLKNGFTVTGESACASAENFDAEIGRKVARQHALDKCWPLLGYALRDKLAGQGAS